MTGTETHPNLPIVETASESSRSKSVIDRTITLAELLDINAFKDICTSFVDLYKIGIKIFDADGSKLIDIRVHTGDWCGYIFQNKVGRQKCTALVTKIKSHPFPGLSDGAVVEQTCFSGLKYVIMPIMYGGDYLGRVIYGPFRPADLTEPGAEVREFPDFDPVQLWSYGHKIRKGAGRDHHQDPQQLPGRHRHRDLRGHEGADDAAAPRRVDHLELQRAQRHEPQAPSQPREARRARPHEVELPRDDQPRASHPPHERDRLFGDAAGGHGGGSQRRAEGLHRHDQEKGDSLLSLIGSLLDMSKHRSGRAPARHRGRGHSHVVEEARTTVVPLAKKKHLTLQTDIGDDADESAPTHAKLRQCLVNLLGNAVKFTPEGGRITVRAHRVRSRAAGGPAARFGAPEREFLRFDVEDTGIGIPAEKLQQVFGSFYQVDNSITREHGGTGLGLSIVKRFVEAHGGTVEVRSETGRGTVFSMTLPTDLEGGEVDMT
jgi:two-component system sensor histidine kinase BarA